MTTNNKTNKIMETYIAPVTVEFCFEAQNMIALSIVSGKGGNTTVIDVDTDSKLQLTRDGGWGCENWTSFDDEE